MSTPVDAGDAPAPGQPTPASAAVGPIAGPTRPWVLRHRYSLLAGLVTLLTAVQTVNGQWSSDMWQHVAVVRELIQHPFDPSHPQVLADVAHPGFSPYTVVLGLIGNVTGADAVTLLSIAAVVNVVALLVALRLFVLEMTENRRAPFWALLFVLTLWGPSPYRFSGFFGLNSIGFVAPYPSTLATAIGLAVLTATSRLARDGRLIWLVPIGVGTAAVVLVHPLSAPWLVVGLAALAVSRVRDERVWAGLAATGAVVAGVCLVWPYYSIASLVLEGGEYDSTNASMYTNVLLRLLPAGLGLVVVVRRWRDDHRDALGLLLGGAAILYVGGFVTGHQSYGRALAFAVIVLDVALADGVGRIEATLRRGAVPRAVTAGALALGALVVFGVAVSASGLVRMVPTGLLPASLRGSDELARRDEQYSLLAGVVGPDDVVLGSTDDDDLVIPAIAGRTVALGWAAPFLSDVDQRRYDAAELLEPATSPARRAELLDAYDVRFVVVHPASEAGRSLQESLAAEGATIAASNGELILVRLPAEP